MSTKARSQLETRRLTRRSEGGFTLPELLISITLMGILAAVLSAAISVTYRQANSTEGRANVARGESAVDTWLPADLASTDVKNTTLPAVERRADASPCGNCGSIDMSGTNALQLAWKMNGVTTRVQYQYIQIGTEWQLRRIECVDDGSPCKVAVVLHDLDGPPNPATFDPKRDRPVWVMDVSDPTNPTDIKLSDNARRIVVTIDGGGENLGAGGGLNSISLTAGGRSTDTIKADDFTVPSFVRAKSRCGGPITLIVDDSGSIGGNVNSVVKPGVNAFIEAFRGTPTQVQIVQFSSKAQAIGPDGASANGGWHRYVDMTNDAQVKLLKDAVNGKLVANGGTNWEEAFFHTFKESDGNPAAIVPNRIVFFTDGIPTRNRTSKGHKWEDPYSNGKKFVNYNAGTYNSNWPIDAGSVFNQESWDRADVILDQHRNVDMVFVGVGPDLNDPISWIHDPAVYQDVSVNPPTAIQKKASDTIAYLLANAPSGQVPAVYDSNKKAYTNPETADFYLQNSFDADAFGAAMKAAALKDCGGTLTLQTRLPDGTPVGKEFVYENANYRDDKGKSLLAKPRVVTTSQNFRTGTFDFEISNSSSYFSVDIVPSELQTLTDFKFVGWTCRAGSDDRTGGMKKIKIEGSKFEGFTIDVKPNEAISCILEVTK